MTEGMTMVSFDVESLFPSIPVKKALAALNDHLTKFDVPIEKKSIYMKAAELCMNMNFFEYRDRFYKIEKGTSMGNPLSPLIAEIFMSKFEMELKSKNLLPMFWKRYVDDVFTIIKRTEVPNLLEILNRQYDEINFTCEIEENSHIVFLDLDLYHNNDGKIDIGIHHKATSTLRLIPSDSHTPIQHKLAAFNSLAHRLVNLPLSVNNYLKEYKHIKDAALVNGYSLNTIDRIIKQHARKKERNDLSTLFSQNQDATNTMKRVAVIFAPEITNDLKTVFANNNMQIVHSNPFKLKNHLLSTKDKKEHLDKPGIYEIACNSCGRKYYGQTKRSVRKRFKEHTLCIRNNEPRKSAFAQHALDEEHLTTTIDNVRLLKSVNNSYKLDAYESLYIHRDATALNLDKGNIESDLFCFMPNERKNVHSTLVL